MRFADKAAESGAAHLVTASVPSLPKPSAALFVEAEEAEQTWAEHDRLAHDLPAFNAVELVAPPAGPAPGAAFRVAAWNAERLKHAAASATLVMATGADILLLIETDRGMARSGNRHTTADLATALGMGYVFGVEFIELGLGDDRERVWHRGETNRVGFHGNALLSRLPIADAALIRLDDGAVWWLDALKGQRRLGWRMAIAARIETTAGPLLAVVVHLESKSDPADRASQVARLIIAIEALAEGMPVIIGGDFNTKALPPGTLRPDLDLAAHEPLFALMAAAGFDWRGANTADASQRRLTDGKPEPPFRRLDWLFTRGLVVRDPVTIPAVDGQGDAISDHELIAIDVMFG